MMDICWKKRWVGIEKSPSHYLNQPCSWGLINTEDGPQRWCRVHDSTEPKTKPCLAAR